MQSTVRYELHGYHVEIGTSYKSEQFLEHFTKINALEEYFHFQNVTVTEAQRINDAKAVCGTENYGKILS